MANGILDINTDENQQDDNLFLSAPEQRGLEAATYATAIGQAPATGSIFGDIFSTLAQTGPAALSTFKERQSIKEKEAEYKEKKQSLAGKIKFIDAYDTTGGELTYTQLTENEFFNASRKTPGRYIKYFKKHESPKVVLDNRVGSPTKGQNVDYLGAGYIDFRNNYTKNAQIAQGTAIEDINLPFLPKIENVTVYDRNLPRGFRKKEMTTKEFNDFKKTKGDSYMGQVTTGDAPLWYTAETEETLDMGKRGRESREAIKPQLVAAKSMLDYKDEITVALLNKGTSGGARDVVLSIADTVGFVSSGYEALANSLFPKLGGKTGADADYKNMQGDQQLINYLENKRDKQGGLSGSENKIYKVLTNTMTGGQEVIADAQRIKTAVTQLVYMVAKTRESGGKFSVPDIQFAFDSIGDGSDPTRLLTGIDSIMREAVSSVVDKTEFAFFNQLEQKPATLTYLYNNPELNPVKRVFEYHAINKLPFMQDKEIKDFLAVLPKNSTTYNIFYNALEKDNSKKKPVDPTDELLKIKKLKEKI